MSGETESQVSGWTTDTLHSLVLRLFSEKDLRDQQRFEAQQKALTDALLAQEKAVSAALLAANTAVGKAETANEKRLDAVNEFRGQLKDQAFTFLTRDAADARFSALVESISELKDRANRSEGRGAGAVALWGYLVGGMGMVIAVFVLIRDLAR